MEPGGPCRVAERFGEILLHEEIRRLLSERQVQILAHCDQTDAVRGTADMVGDDLALLLHAEKSGVPELVVCAPDVIAETIHLLAPDARVILPVPGATCPAAREITPADLSSARELHPGAAVVLDVRSTAECKSLADITCTPEILRSVVASLEEAQVLLAVPSLDPAFLWEGYSRGKEVLPLPSLRAASGDRIPGGGDHPYPCTGPFGPASRDHRDDPGTGKGFFPRNCTNCHGMRQTTLPDLYRSLITGGARVELAGATLRAARRPVLRMMAVVGREP